MKIVLVVVGPLFIVVGLFWFGQGMGLLAGPHCCTDRCRRGRRSLRYRPCVVRVAVAQDSLAPIGRPEQPRRNRTHQRPS